ncbi:MAG: DNA primase [bacterium ADurb.Bin400]|nr:MAG: DNA primase [bacterium ADurb.Bin400]
MGDEIEEIKRRLDIAEVISSYLTLKKAGANLKGICPFHHEKTPSFMVSPERQTFKCFGCGEGGDIFTFIEKVEGLDFYNALKILADRAGVKLTRQSVQRGDTEHKADRKTRIFEVNDWAKKLYHKILLEHPKAERARSYLRGRGLTDQTIKEFEIGYAPDSWSLLIEFLKKKGYTEDEMSQAGLVVRKDNGGFFDRFRGRIMFPINNIMGNTIAFTSRILQDDAKEAKYLNSAESPIYRKGETIYGLDKAKLAIKEANTVVVVEGNMDVIACHQAGFKNVVATSGTALTEHQLRVMVRYAPEIAFCFDSDTAGETAMKRAVTLALKMDIASRIIALAGPYKDPDEAIKADPKNWVRAVEQAKPSLEYWIDLLVRKDPDLSVLAKKKIAKEILPVIKITYSPIERESYIKYLSRKIAVSESSLIDALDKTKTEETKGENQPAAGKKKELTVAERLLALAWFDQTLLEGDRHPEVAVPNLEKYCQMIQQGKINRAALGSEETSLLDQMVILLSESLDMENKEALKEEFDFLVYRLKSDQKEQVKTDFAARIRQAEESGDKAMVKQLLQEFSSLIK